MSNHPRFVLTSDEIQRLVIYYTIYYLFLLKQNAPNSSSCCFNFLQVSVIVTDGGANIVSAAKNVFGDARHVICVDHSLSRITTVAIDQSPLFKILLTKIRSIVAFFKKSINAADEIRALQLKEVSSNADILKLIKDEPTRWGSNYAMLERFIKLADKVSLLAAATEGRDLLQPVAHTITELKGETVSLSGKVIPMLKNMKRSIDSMSPTTEPVRQLKTMFQAQYERKFKDIEFVDTFSIATLLDPRFKTLYLCPLAHAKVLKNVSDMVQIANKDSTTNPNEISSFASKAGSNNLWNFHHQMLQSVGMNFTAPQKCIGKDRSSRNRSCSSDFLCESWEGSAESILEIDLFLEIAQS
ncbi:E3 SUMO-protein ligase ZBED1-like [Wyeomyia smithii]|uniref:E3 SUMO-protein ligase ZBED1-like n=1 Tax=Wyeomyia smithii TaxID=174621 RepID=UPI002467B919|nr:E3 SUMO-protein ligase ZBED1-like [Wyeomyia smithii]